jgi:hypothetical protein
LRFFCPSPQPAAGACHFPPSATVNRKSISLILLLHLTTMLCISHTSYQL